MELARPNQPSGGSVGSGLSMSAQFSMEDPNALSGSHSCSDISITQQVASVGMMLHVCVTQTGSKCSEDVWFEGTFSVAVLLNCRQHPSGEAADHSRQQRWCLCCHTSTAEWAEASHWGAIHASRPCNATARHVLLQNDQGCT